MINHKSCTPMTIMTCYIALCLAACRLLVNPVSVQGSEILILACSSRKCPVANHELSTLLQNIYNMPQKMPLPLPDWVINPGKNFPHQCIFPVMPREFHSIPTDSILQLQGPMKSHTFNCSRIVSKHPPRGHVWCLMSPNPVRSLDYSHKPSDK